MRPITFTILRDHEAYWHIVCHKWGMLVRGDDLGAAILEARTRSLSMDSDHDAVVSLAYLRDSQISDGPWIINL